MQGCNEYNYVHYEFLVCQIAFVQVLHILDICFSQIWLYSPQIVHAYSWQAYASSYV